MCLQSGVETRNNRDEIILSQLKQVEGTINKILKDSDNRIYSSIQKLMSGKGKMDLEGLELNVDLDRKDNN